MGGDFVRQEGSVMSSGKRTLLVLAGIAIMLVVGVFSPPVILLRDILVHDESSPPDDSDLLLVRPEVPAGAGRPALGYHVAKGQT